MLESVLLQHRNSKRMEYQILQTFSSYFWPVHLRWSEWTQCACVCVCVCVCVPACSVCALIPYNVSFIEGINWLQSHLNGNLMNLLAMLCSPPCLQAWGGRDASAPSQSGGPVALGSTAPSLQRPSSSFSVGQEREESGGPKGLWPHWPPPPVPAGSLQGHHQHVYHWYKRAGMSWSTDMLHC